MAKIGRSDSAPDGDFTVNFADGSLEFEGSGSAETDDPRLVSEAVSHPWLVVEDYEVESETEEEKSRAQVAGTEQAHDTPEAPVPTSDPPRNTRTRSND